MTTVTVDLEKNFVAKSLKKIALKKSKNKPY